MNYPPPYYWVVGLGQKFAPEADRWMDVGGRAASVLLNFAAILLIWLLTMRRSRYWATNVLAVTTPMVAFMWAVVNPNGWEISAGLIFGYVFARAWWNSERPLGIFPSPRWSRMLVAVASLAFGTSRHDAMVWLVVVVLVVLLMGRTTLTRVDRWWLIAAASVGVWAGALWQMTHPAQHTANNPNRVADPTLLDQLHWLGQIDAFLPRRIQEMVGLLGGLDTPVPQLFVLVLVIAWAALLGMIKARTDLGLPALIVGGTAILVVPSLMEVVRWNDWPYWYQGRITLPFAVTFLFLILIRFGSSSGRAVVLLSVLNAFLLTYMVWLNLMRYSFGISDYLPLRLGEPAVGLPTFWFVSAIVLVMLLACSVRVVWLVQGAHARAASDETIVGAAR